MESTPFFIFLFIHLTGLILGFGAVLVTDLFGMLWVFNRVRFPHLVRVSETTKNFIWAGWGILVAAGIPLIYLKGEIDNLMVIKLFFVLLIGINGIALHHLQSILKKYKIGENVPTATMFRLSLSLGLSQISWWGAFMIGFMHRHVQAIIEWPASPIVVCALFLEIILIIWASGEILFRVKENMD